jgi:uncharacterized membrane protein
MASTSQDGDWNTDSGQNLSLPNIRLSDPDRLEAFSDGVLSITITLLVFDIVRPEYESGHLLQKLQAQWPNYIAFLASFFYVGIIWLNHRAVFSRVRYCSRSLHVANLLLLLTSGLIPFPTAVLSTALQHGSPVDATTAAVLYAAVGCLMCLSWLFVFHVLSITFWRLMSSGLFSLMKGFERSSEWPFTFWPASPAGPFRPRLRS